MAPIWRLWRYGARIWRYGANMAQGQNMAPGFNQQGNPLVSMWQCTSDPEAIARPRTQFMRGGEAGLLVLRQSLCLRRRAVVDVHSAHCLTRMPTLAMIHPCGASASPAAWRTHRDGRPDPRVASGLAMLQSRNAKICRCNSWKHTEVAIWLKTYGSNMAQATWLTSWPTGPNRS